MNFSDSWPKDCFRLALLALLLSFCYSVLLRELGWSVNCQPGCQSFVHPVSVSSPLILSRVEILRGRFSLHSDKMASLTFQGSFELSVNAWEAKRERERDRCQEFSQAKWSLTVLASFHVWRGARRLPMANRQKVVRTVHYCLAFPQF